LSTPHYLFRYADDGVPHLGLATGSRAVDLADGTGPARLADWLTLADPASEYRQALESRPVLPHTLTELQQQGQLLAPLDRQEVWAAGVTYLRSKVARMEESEGGGSFYDRVYDAERPEIFLKATPSRVVGPGGPVRIRRDSEWNVPEPELALVIAPDGRLVGYTLGNDMSSRDIEGENPLYLPQAKVYRESCALGPAILLEEEPRSHREFAIRLSIARGEQTVFEGETSTDRMKRQFTDLIEYLIRDNLFPDGAFLLTGTGIVPPDDFTLEPGDQITIECPEIGSLSNRVVRD
jgi:2-dehydro-3-deoxy-D-arabinonate dehydratase